MKFVLLVMLIVLISAEAYALQLTRNGMTDAIIVVGKDASAPEKNAAVELAKYLKQISGASFEIQPQAAEGRTNIFVGQTDITKSMVPGFDWSSIERDGIIIRSSKNSLILAGDRPRGTIYAVYEFLEKYLGVRFLTVDAELVPENKNIRISNNINYVYTPQMFSREVYFCQNINNPGFAVKLKLNGSYNRISEEWGGNCELIGFGHTFGSMLLREQDYFAEHPEWYALRDGKRVPTQPCLSNPEVLEKLTENVLKELDKRENPQMISVTQNDNAAPCQCEKCQAMVKEFGAESGMLINALNYIAEKIKDKYPNVMLETFAYQYTVPAPTNIIPADNVIVRICDIENNFGEPIIEQSRNKPYKVMENCRIFDYANQQTVNGDYYKNLTAWGKLAKHLFIWNYTVNFNNYYIIHPNFHVLKKDIDTFLDNNACAIFEQGDAANHSAAFNVVKQYLMAHLIWNPNMDDDAIIREFMQNYYGPAWKDLYDIITYCEKIIIDKHIFLSTYMNDTSWMTADEMSECFRLFSMALSKVSDNKPYRDRVYNELMSFQIGWYLADDETRRAAADSGWMQITDRDKFAKVFYEHACSTGNARYCESTPLDSTEMAPVIPLIKSGFVPKECEGLKDNEWLEIPASQFSLAREGELCKLIRDKKAVTGNAAVLFTNSVEWAINRNLGAQLKKMQKDGYKSMHLYADLRTGGKAAAADDKDILQVIIWESYGYAFRRTVKGRELGDDYRTIDLGTFALSNLNVPCLYFYTSNDSDFGDGIYIDRVYCTFEK